MARLKGNQEAMERGEWNDVPDQQRQELDNTFRHTGQIARYTNIMGVKTVREIREYFRLEKKLLMIFS
jgi:hypothetical protein